MADNIIYDYVPNISVIHDSPESTTTTEISAVDGIEELIQGKIVKL